jgi:hypothetical protein
MLAHPDSLNKSHECYLCIFEMDKISIMAEYASEN